MAGVSASANGLARLAYGGFFTVLVPLALMAWAWAASSNVGLPAMQSTTGGLLLCAVGATFLVGGWWALWHHGGGLPMNAFPPPRPVTCGVYRVVRDPIYVGFCLVVAGVSIWTASAAGLWLIAPMTAAACAALVWGYERQDLHRRFGEQRLGRPWLSLPPADDARPGVAERIGASVCIWLPWLIVYEALLWAGLPRGAVQAFLPFEREWSVVEWTEWIYASAYVVVPLSPWACRTRAEVRRLMQVGWTLTLAFAWVMVAAPFVAPRRPFEPMSLAGRLLALEQAAEGQAGSAAFPSYHVGWALFAAAAFARRGGPIAVAAGAWAIAVAISCLTTGMHALIDVIAAAVLFPLVWRVDTIWRPLRRGSERLANAFVERRVGPLRLLTLNACFAGAAATIAAIAMLLFAGPGAAWHVFGVAVAGVIGAAAWAQVVEAGSGLARPFGYYGSVVAVMIACVAVGVAGGDGWRIAAAIALAAPIVQAVGRLRCLVQGCCHGRPCDDPRLAIRVTHPRSRVVHLAHFAGVPIHPTPLYSILVNVGITSLLARLWNDGAATSTVVGLYLMLAGVTRFVEESFRGEPQTPGFGGLTVYHWTAAISFVVGAATTCVPSPVAGGWDWPGGWASLAAIGFGLAVAVAMGVDVPGSSRRFSRLAPVDPLS